MARTTPAQKPRGAQRTTRSLGFCGMAFDPDRGALFQTALVEVKGGRPKPLFALAKFAQRP
jgi:hypothetical protein